jgi:hypothetical protein
LRDAVFAARARPALLAAAERFAGAALRAEPLLAPFFAGAAFLDAPAFFADPPLRDAA